MFRNILTASVALLTATAALAQPAVQAEGTQRAHSHNDYAQAAPFWSAYRSGFASIEADVFLRGTELMVAHNKADIKADRTLQSLYLEPLSQVVREKGSVYANPQHTINLLIDLKTNGDSTYDALLKILESYPVLQTAKGLKFVITGSQPSPAKMLTAPGWIGFDGDLSKQYTAEQLQHVALFSDNFGRYSKWNGLGKLTQPDRRVIDSLVRKAHAMNKPVRFWNAPDVLNSWYAYLDLGVDYINTDHIPELTAFFQTISDRSFTATAAETYDTYQPTYRNDGTDKPVKNIILLIGDGTSLPQWYAGYTANHGKLNVFNMHYTGLSKTSSSDNYITDSAPGASTIATGKKTNNRWVGLDSAGRKLTALPELLRDRRKMKTGIITSGDLRDATPAAFYAHVRERSMNHQIILDLLNDPVDLIAGKCEFKGDDSLAEAVKATFDFFPSLSAYKPGTKTAFIADSVASLHMQTGRGTWAQKALALTIDRLKHNPGGFFIMLEGAQIDHGGHANKLPWMVTELLNFDQTIGEAMRFADSNGETLVIVAADHETGGLTLTGGDYATGKIQGQFSTGDHTALPIPVFAYGPQSNLFTGVYENTDLFFRILKALKLKFSN